MKEVVRSVSSARHMGLHSYIRVSSGSGPFVGASSDLYTPRPCFTPLFYAFFFLL